MTTTEEYVSVCDNTIWVEDSRYWCVKEKDHEDGHMAAVEVEGNKIAYLTWFEV